MFYPKLRHASSNSIIDISSIKNSKHILYSPSSKSFSNQNQSRYFSHHELCHSYSNDSLDKEFIQNTKQTFNKIFHQNNFNEILNQIQFTLQPIVDQLRIQIQQKKDRFICIKSCAKFITETLLNEQLEINHQFPELYQLQQVLNQVLLKQQTNISTQTNEELEIDMMQLKIGDNLKKTDSSIQKLKKPSKVSLDLTRQKNYHRSVSRAFRKLNSDLQKMNHETPFKSHLSKYHKHNH